MSQLVAALQASTTAASVTLERTSAMLSMNDLRISGACSSSSRSMIYRVVGLRALDQAPLMRSCSKALRFETIVNSLLAVFRRMEDLCASVLVAQPQRDDS